MFSFTLNAKSPESLIVLEQFSQNGIKIKSDVMIVSQRSEVFINGEKLSNTEIITQSSSIKAISTFLSKENENCSKGRFKHILKQGSLLKTEEGCLFSKRFNELKKDNITK